MSTFLTQHQIKYRSPDKNRSNNVRTGVNSLRAATLNEVNELKRKVGNTALGWESNPGLPGVRQARFLKATRG